MSELNKINCEDGGLNTGFGDCYVDFKDVRGGFLVSKDFELTEAQMQSTETIMDALYAAVVADQKRNRIFPLPPTVDITDNSEEDVFETLGSGVPLPVRPGNYNWLQRFTQGGMCALTALMSHNGTGKRYIFFDGQGLLIGTKVGTSLKGIPLYYFNAQKFVPANGSATAIFRYGLSFAPEYINQNIAFVKLNLSELQNITGLQNAEVSATRAGNVLTAKAVAGCANRANLYDEYDTELAAVGMWRASNAATGNDITITSVAANANAKGWTVTLNASDADYDAAVGVVLNLAPVSVLDVAGITGYEGVRVIVNP